MEYILPAHIMFVQYPDDDACMWIKRYSEHISLSHLRNAMHCMMPLKQVVSAPSSPSLLLSMFPYTSHSLSLPLSISPLSQLPISPSLASYSHTCSYGLNGHGVTTPKPSLMLQLISDAFIIAIISFVINISQAKLLAKKNAYSVHPDQVRTK